MTDKELFIKTMEDELPRFVRVLEAIPNKNLDYRPHPRSKSAKELLQLFTGEPKEFAIIVEYGLINFDTFKRPLLPKKRSGLVKVFKQNMNRIIKTAKKLDAKKWSSKARMIHGGKVGWETSRGWMSWGLLLDLIHHRGQLSTYIRPMGGKVPSIYGPSADSK